MARLFATNRALDDLDHIYAYSLEQWRQATAERYLERFDHAFQMLQQAPDLLKERDDCPGWLRFYRVEKHWLVCDVFDDRIYVLTIKHGAMNLPARLSELEPMLKYEVSILHQRIDGQ